MTRLFAMGIDLGGGGVRCLLLDTGSGHAVSAGRRWRFPKADDASGLAYDLDLDAMWALIGEASREAMSKAGVDAAAVGSVAVSAMRFATVILDKKGEPLFAVPNRDARASAEYCDLSERCGDDILCETGLWPLSIQTSARLKWLQANDPARFGKADCVLSLGDWVNYRLCGARVTDYSQAGCTGLFSLSDRTWSASLLEKLDLEARLFPDVKDSGTAIGSLSAEAAAHLGLADSAVVGLGGGDTQCSLLGAGAVNAGDYACVGGTTAPVVAVVDRPVIDEQGRTWSGHHVVPGCWLLESSGGAMGESLSWMARLLFPDAPEPELRLLAEAARSEYGAKGLLSGFGADVMDARAPSIPAGHIALTHLSSTDDPDPRRHLCRAVVEGYACAVRANLDQIRSVTGTDYKTIDLTDGFSRSAVFSRILADICAAPVRPAAQPMSSATGAALCAAVAAGTYADLEAAGTSLVKPREPSVPDKDRAQAAAKAYADWAALREASGDRTIPRIRDHMLEYVFAPGAETMRADDAIDLNPAALVTASFDESSLSRLREVMDVEYASFRDAGRMLAGSDLVQALQGRQVFVTEIDIVDARVLRDSPDLRVVAACRGNAVNVDVDACTAFGVPVISAPGRNAVAVADLTVAFMLALARKLMAAAAFLGDESVSAGDMGKMGQAFVELQGRELWQKTIGLVGLGAVGRMVVSRLQGFGARIIAADPFATAEAAALAGCELVDLDTLLRESDFVSLHAAVTPETTGMIGAGEFAKMKPGAFFVNTARAALVDEPALIEAVECERIAGAALDTFAEEPPGWDHPLVRHPHVLSTPHVAGNTHEVASHQGESVSRALLQLLRGERPDNCLNPEVLEAFSWRAPRRNLSDAEVQALMEKPAPAVTDLEKNRKRKAAQADGNGAERAAPAGKPAGGDIRRDLVDTVNELYEQHIITATGGNVSVRNPDNPQECWITPSRMFKGDLRPELMVRIDLEGKALDSGSRSPSSEWGFHTRTLQKNSRANAVIHAHAPYATILANTGLPFLPISTEAAFFGEIKRIPFIMPGTPELAEAVSDALTEEWAVFMINHGIVVAGTSLRSASDIAQIIERSAEVIVGCYQATGKPPPVLPEEAVTMLRSMKDIMA